MNTCINQQPPFIIFEGVDFTGKSTIAVDVVLELQKRGILSTYYRSPGGSPRGEELRELCRNGDLNVHEQLDVFLEALTATLDYIDGREWHVPVLDRFTLSTAFYQVKQLEPSIYGSDRYIAICEKIAQLNKRLTIGRKKPLLIVLDITEEEFEKRKAKEALKITEGRTKDRFESMSIQEQHGILKCYHNAKHGPWCQDFNLVMVDVNRSLPEVFEDVMSRVEIYLQ